MTDINFPDIEADAISGMTAEQLLSAKTCQMIVDKEDRFEQDKCLNLCLLRCKEVGITARNFTNLLKEYKIKLANMRGVARGNKTKFIDQPIELNCGDWICDISGVKKNQVNISSGNVECKFASPIPVLVTEILKNIDDDTEKVKIMYFKEGWHSLICNRSTTASNTKIIELADKGLEVNSDNAKLLVKYIADLIALNLDIIPKYKAISKLGWLDNEFMPYSDIKFDGENEYKHLYESVTSRGDFDKWLKYTGELRKNKYLRLQMAASFAAPIVSKVNALSFILHFWGGTGNGKTVGAMVAASIWGNPKIGAYVRTMNNTLNNTLAIAAFFNNLPVVCDELQTIKKQGVSYDKLIMQCTEGVGRGRMKYDKVQRSQTWETAFIFTGEEPCTHENSGGGTKNRVIEFECVEKVVEDGKKVVNFILENYGFAGRKFVKCIADENLQERYAEIFKELLERDTTEKQAMAMACMLLGDEMACKYIYTDEKPLQVQDVSEFLKTNKEVDVSERAYEWVLNFIAVNNNKFNGSEVSECWGKIDEEYIYINKNILTSQMSSNNFEFDAVKTKWADKGYLVKNSQGRLFHCTKCYGIKGTYIKIRQKPDEVVVIPDEAPF